MEHFFTTLWGLAIFLGFVGALFIYLLVQIVTRPTTLRIAETVRLVMAGQGPQDAPDSLEALAARQRKVLSIQAAIGTLVVLSMVVARFS